MSNTGLGLRDALDLRSDALDLRSDALDLRSDALLREDCRREDLLREELPRTQSRRAEAQAQARARNAVHDRGPRIARDHMPRAFSPYDSGRTRIDANGVRTVKIRGQATPPRRRPLFDAARPAGRYDQRPDRMAQWALFLGVFMVIVAIVTGS